MRKIATLTTTLLFFVICSFSRSEVDIGGIPISEDIGGVSLFVVDVSEEGRRDCEAINYNPFMVAVVCSVRCYKGGEVEEFIVSKIIDAGLSTDGLLSESGSRGRYCDSLSIRSITRRIE